MSDLPPPEPDTEDDPLPDIVKFVTVRVAASKMSGSVYCCWEEGGEINGVSYLARSQVTFSMPGSDGVLPYWDDEDGYDD